MKTEQQPKIYRLFYSNTLLAWNVYMIFWSKHP